MNLKPTWLHALMSIACQPCKSSTELGRRLGTSQQTAARWLQQLKKESFAEKHKTYAVSPTGEAYLFQLQGAKRTLDGTVFSGVGEGKYYLSKDGYQRQFPGLLGFTPYPGTLNLRIQSAASLAVNRQLRRTTGRHLDGFKETDRTYGGARCYPCRIVGPNAQAAGDIIVPERTHYPEDVVELLAPVFLRKTLGLHDGSSVRLELD